MPGIAGLTLVALGKMAIDNIVVTAAGLDEIPPDQTPRWALFTYTLPMPALVAST